MKLNKQEIGLGLLRIAVGIIFLAHGYQKLFFWGIAGVTGTFAQMGIPFPAVSAYLAAFAEFFGGLALLLGLWTRLAAVPVAFTMLVAMLQVHLKGGFFLPSGIEYTLVLLVSNIAFMVAGGGAFAVENLFRTRDQAALAGGRLATEAR